MFFSKRNRSQTPDSKQTPKKPSRVPRETQAAAAPAAATVQAGAGGMPAEVQAAADKVRELKAAKASKEEIKAAVDVLLGLKEKHGLLEDKKEDKKKSKKDKKKKAQV